MAPSALANHDVDVIEHVTIGPAGGNTPNYDAGLWGISADGGKAWINTWEALTADDTDSYVDVYERSGGTTRLLSIGPTGGNGPFISAFIYATADGSHVFFRTEDPLVAADTDDRNDIYDSHDGTVTLVSTGPTDVGLPGYASWEPQWRGASTDGTHVFFGTSEHMTADDTDSSFAFDIFERVNGTTERVSTGPTGGNSGQYDSLLFDRARPSADGSRFFFTTEEGLVADDTDNLPDVYERSSGTTTLISAGTGYARLTGSSADGSRVFFETPTQLVPEDTDTYLDVYVRSGGATTLVSTGPAGGNGAAQATVWQISEDGSHVFFVTPESLTANDTDGYDDLYDWASGTTSLVSTGSLGGNGPYKARFARSTPDGSHVFFDTGETLEPADIDGGGLTDCFDDDESPLRPCRDVYERANGTTKLVSTGPVGGGAAVDAYLSAVSDDGKRAFFGTDESLVPQDTDTCSDGYERFNDTTKLITTRPSGTEFCAGIGPASRDGTKVFYATRTQLVDSDSDLNSDFYAVRVVPHDHPRGALRLSVSLVPELLQTISASQCQARGGFPSTHGAPLSLPSCNSPVYDSGTAARFRGAGRATLAAVRGFLSTVADESDLSLVASLSDVQAAAGGDYVADPGGPDATLLATMRISDLQSGTYPSDSGTTIDFELSAPIECSATSDPAVGSDCTVNTTADALSPGTISEAKSMAIQTFRVHVNDAGPNGVRGDADDKPLASQGIYVP